VVICIVVFEDIFEFLLDGEEDEFTEEGWEFVAEVSVGVGD
jgi:hypothetical protein